MKQFEELSAKEKEKQISNFLLKLIKDLDTGLNKEQINYIEQRMNNWLQTTAYMDYRLKEIYEEIVCNYRKYLPFCYASIRTANNELHNKDR